MNWEFNEEENFLPSFTEGVLWQKKKKKKVRHIRGHTKERKIKITCSFVLVFPN